jgi:hypothetical protein
MIHAYNVLWSNSSPLRLSSSLPLSINNVFHYSVVARVLRALLVFHYNLKEPWPYTWFTVDWNMQRVTSCNSKSQFVLLLITDTRSAALLTAAMESRTHICVFPIIVSSSYHFGGVSQPFTFTYSCISSQVELLWVSVYLQVLLFSSNSFSK